MQLYLVHTVHPKISLHLDTQGYCKEPRSGPLEFEKSNSGGPLYVTALTGGYVKRIRREKQNRPRPAKDRGRFDACRSEKIPNRQASEMAPYSVSVSASSDTLCVFFIAASFGTAMQP